jgi:hypothetical protein
MQRKMAALLAALLVGVFAARTGPRVAAAVRSQQVAGTEPDSFDYAYGAQVLLHGRYAVSWQGGERRPYYTPGLSILLMPSVACGGVAAAVWTCWVAALALGTLAAALAFELDSPAAAPLAVVLVLFTPAAQRFAEVVMTELPAASLLAFEALLLAAGRGWWSAAGAGALAGCLVWIRPAAVAYLLAGLAAVTALPEKRRRAAAYLVGALPLLTLLGAWQWLEFGSPLTTTYQAGHYTPLGGADLAGMFSWRYAFAAPSASSPMGREGPDFGGLGLAWSLPNGLLYPLQLLGLDGFLLYPGVGVLGLIGVWRYARHGGARAAVARFGAAVIATTLAVYVPYFYQSGRFLFGAAVFLGCAAAALTAETTAGLWRR